MWEYAKRRGVAAEYLESLVNLQASQGFLLRVLEAESHPTPAVAAEYLDSLMQLHAESQGIASRIRLAAAGPVHSGRPTALYFR